MAERELEFERLTFFSDAVIAIAITLLAVDIGLPEHLTAATIGEALGDLLPSLTAFAISFAVIGIYWVAHHRMFRYVTAWDGRLLVLNLVFLFFIAIQPFTTSVLGEHGDLALATIVYALGMMGTGLSPTAMWLHAVRSGLVEDRLSPRQKRFLTIRALMAPIVFAASIPVALFSPTAAEVTWAAVLPLPWLLSHWLDASLPPAAGEHRLHG